MSKYRNRLPQLHDAQFITDGGLETTLIYHDGLELPAFAAFDLLKDDVGLKKPTPQRRSAEHAERTNQECFRVSRREIRRHAKRARTIAIFGIWFSLRALRFFAPLRWGFVFPMWGAA